MGLAHYSSQKSRETDHGLDEKFMGEDKEWLLIHSKEVLKQRHFDYFIFGHRHLAIDFRLSDNSRYINLGEWMNFDSYAVFDGSELELKSFSGKESKIYKNW
jgi:UDP-2,3-diacylglucosamine hydrolase